MSDAQAVIRSRKLRTLRRRDGLIQFASDYTSQNGEDGILAAIFAAIVDRTPCEMGCVDVGAWDGKHLSNTYSLLQNGWKGLLIEADPSRFKELSALYQDTRNTCLNIAISSALDSPSNLYHILKKHNVPADFDFLCIDIDGSDYWVLRDVLDHDFAPRVICIEYNPTMPDDLIYIPPRDDSVRHGASLSALVELASSRGYVLVETTLYNAFFVRELLYAKHLADLVPDTSIEALHAPTMTTSLYQLYDGTLKISGCKKLLWHRKPIDENKLQMLDKTKRKFPFAPPDASFEEPVVDLSSYRSADGDPECAKQIFDQLKSNGFCYVKGTGMTRESCQTALDFTNAFLQECDEAVRRSTLTRDRARRGYSPMNVENFASLIGEQKPNDLVRKFRVGPLESGTNSLLQPNVWPSLEQWVDADAFRSSIERYYSEACIVASNIVRVICDGVLLEHPELKGNLSALLQNDSSDSTASSILALLGYRQGTRHKGKNKGPLVAAHTDVGVVTVLIFDGSDSCAQLQRSDGDQGWVDVKLPTSMPEDPVFVVNVADCFSALCGGLIPSTLHRVVARPKFHSPRNCCALFVGLDPSASIHIDGDVFSYEEWRKRRIAQAQSVLVSRSQEKNSKEHDKAA